MVHLRLFRAGRRSWRSGRERRMQLPPRRFRVPASLPPTARKAGRREYVLSRTAAGPKTVAIEADQVFRARRPAGPTVVAGPRRRSWFEVCTNSFERGVRVWPKAVTVPLLFQTWVRRGGLSPESAQAPAAPSPVEMSPPRSRPPGEPAGLDDQSVSDVFRDLSRLVRRFSSARIPAHIEYSATGSRTIRGPVGPRPSAGAGRGDAAVAGPQVRRSHPSYDHFDVVKEGEAEPATSDYPGFSAIRSPCPWWAVPRTVRRAPIRRRHRRRFPRPCARPRPCGRDVVLGAPPGKHWIRADQSEVDHAPATGLLALASRRATNPKVRGAPSTRAAKPLKISRRRGLS